MLQTHAPACQASSSLLLILRCAQALRSSSRGFAGAASSSKPEDAGQLIKQLRTMSGAPISEVKARQQQQQQQHQ